MKLTKEEIKFIDDYLIKNEVKYWDVRLELLDHIVSAVEDKITNDGISFNEALLEVHHGFGNRIHNGYTYNLDFNQALFIDDKGFKKFTLKKQKEIGRKQRKAFWKTFLPFVYSLRFLLEFLALAVITFLTYLYSFKASFFILTIAIVGIECSKLAYGGFKKFSKRSLNMQMGVSASLLVIQMPYLSIMLFNWYYEGAETKPYYVLFIVGFAAFAISRHGLNIYIKTYKTYKERFELLVS
jgi:hypothetical protein